MDPSGIRFGTPAITTRGFKEKECAQVAELMVEALKNTSNKKAHKRIREDIRKLCKRFPIPESFV
jgi:glycine hydroxymethyltransferase